jgi:branched-chain amino acid transport system permease protein
VRADLLSTPTPAHAQWQSPSFRRAALIALSVVVAAFVLLLPHHATSSEVFFWETVAVQVLFATSVNLLFGDAGIPSFGQAAFFGVGAYTVGKTASAHWSIIAALLLGIALAAVAALVTGLLTWRITGLAFSMLTLAVAQALYTIIVKVGSLGGYNGLSDVLPGKLFGLQLLATDDLWYFTAIAVALGMLGLWRVSRSPFGDSLRAIREDPVRAQFLGLNVRAYRVLAFVISGAAAGLAGGLYAYAYTTVDPTNFYWTTSANPIIMSLVGGMRVFLGPAVGAFLITWLLQTLGQATTSYVLYLGLILLFVLLFLPEGILGFPSRAAMWRRHRSVVHPGSPPVGTAAADATGGRP